MAAVVALRSIDSAEQWKRPIPTVQKNVRALELPQGLISDASFVHITEDPESAKELRRLRRELGESSYPTH
jgi:hypothetical protein